VIVDDARPAGGHLVEIGSTVLVRNVTSGKEISYTLVRPGEAGYSPMFTRRRSGFDSCGRKIGRRVRFRTALSCQGGVRCGWSAKSSVTTVAM
jgi:hypothetical protein